MKSVENNQILDSNAFLDATFTNLDLNQDIQKMYEIINDENLHNDFDRQVELSNLRNENYKKYNKIDISKYTNLPSEFDDVKEDILSFYDYINIKNILTDNYEDSKNNKVVLDALYIRISRLENMIKSYLKEITKYSDEKQKPFSIVYFNNLDIDAKFKKDLIEKYNDLVLHSSKISSDLYEELEIQQKRKEYIDEILKLLNIAKEEKNRLLTQDRLGPINAIINMEIDKYKNKIQYLEDLMIENSKYSVEFGNFRSFFNKLIAYDDTNYENARQTFDILTNDEKLKTTVSSYEALFISEREDRKKEEKFIYEKLGIKNLTNSLDYIAANYFNSLSEYNKNIINYIFKKLNSKNYDIEELNKALKLVVREIWKNEITDVYSYDSNKDFYFICSNNQFIDEKYQTILLTKKEIERVDDYEDYQIGFICNYNDNIMYITENEDIMTVDSYDMSDLKTPRQLEQEFINFKVCNRIALNGYKTKIDAVYLIDDGNKEKYMKAVELANMYRLPLISLKKK